jgi:hypothetical protein
VSTPEAVHICAEGIYQPVHHDVESDIHLESHCVVKTHVRGCTVSTVARDPYYDLTLHAVWYFILYRGAYTGSTMSNFAISSDMSIPR